MTEHYVPYFISAADRAGVPQVAIESHRSVHVYGRGTFERQPQNLRNDAAPQQQARCNAVQHRTNFNLDRYAHTVLHSGLGKKQHGTAPQRCAQNIAGSLQLTQLHTLDQPTSTPDAAPRPATGTANAVPCGLSLIHI